MVSTQASQVNLGYGEDEEITIFREDVDDIQDMNKEIILSFTSDGNIDMAVEEPVIQGNPPIAAFSSDGNLDMADEDPITLVNPPNIPQDPQNCPMRENLASCKIYLCRVIRNMLAMPFPSCYANRF